LNAWEIAFALQRGRRHIRFEFDCSEMVDRNPPGPGEPLEVGFSATARASCEFAAKITANVYPKPPAAFVASEDVQTLMYHYEGCVAGRQRLLDMGNFTLSLLQWRARGRKN